MYSVIFESVLWEDEQSLCSLSSSPLSIKTLKLSSSTSTCEKENRILQELASQLLLSNPLKVLKYVSLLFIE